MTEQEKKSITREKHPERVAHGHKLAALMKKRKEEIIVTKNSLQYRIQYSLQNNLQYSLPYSQMEIMSTVLIYFLSLPLAYFVHVTLFSLKIKNSSMKNRINHQNGFMSLKGLYNK